MMRFVNFFLLTLTGLVCFWLYQIKEDALEAKREIKILKLKIAEERKAFDLLAAEWSYLNQPARLQALLERHGEYLKLKRMKPKQISDFKNLSKRLPAQRFDRKALEGLAIKAENIPQKRPK